MCFDLGATYSPACADPGVLQPRSGFYCLQIIDYILSLTKDNLLPPTGGEQLVVDDLTGLFFGGGYGFILPPAIGNR